MDMNREWTQFAADAEVAEFGTARLCAAHNKLRAEANALRKVAQAAARSVLNPAWAGVCDEDVALEGALCEAGMLPTPRRTAATETALLSRDIHEC